MWFLLHAKSKVIWPLAVRSGIAYLTGFNLFRIHQYSGVERSEN